MCQTAIQSNTIRAEVGSQAMNGNYRSGSRVLWFSAFSLCCVPALAETQSKDTASQLQEITVTATRVVRPGFVAPTPLTTITMSELQLGGITTIGQALDYLPQERATLTPIESAGDPTNLGFDSPDLRGLGQSHTLVLVDGQRPIWTNPSGFDIDVIPASMVKRLDVVTGGASADWGSDAVAGVVNIVLDNDFVGVRGDVQYGKPTTDPGGTEYTGNFAVGSNFGTDNRGHFVLGVEYDDHGEMGPRSAVPGLNYSFIGNPNQGPGQPSQILVPNAKYAIASSGGLIIAGPLAGTAFGPGGTPYAFQYGSDQSGPWMSGGGPGSIGLDNTIDIAPETNTKSAYGRISYDATDNLKVYGSLLYSRVHASAPQAGDLAFPVPISSGNPYIPPSVQAQMTADNLPAILLGRTNEDFDLSGDQLDNSAVQGTIGAQAALGSRWSLNVYYSWGQDVGTLLSGPELINDNFMQAVNAVPGPGGTPVCAIALTDPYSTCAPIDLFGQGSVSSAAARYVLGTAWERQRMAQHEASATVQGEPFSLWAGPVSVAFGGEFRRESVTQSVDSLSQQNAYGGLFGANLSAESGSYSVGEGFLETVAPLLKDMPAFRELDFNGAVRESHYSKSGSVDSWKVGLTDSVTKDLRLRVTKSQDIRAANLAELYTTRTTSVLSVVNPANGNADLVDVYQGGNQNLKPETSHTLTYGAIYQPTWARDLEVSVDWYDIVIDNEITIPNPEQVVNDCYAGIVAECKFITQSGGVISAIEGTYVNIASAEASGLDAELVYGLDMGKVSLPGRLVSRVLAGYTDKNVSTIGSVSSNYGGWAVGLPRWVGTLTESYVTRPVTVDLRVHFVGEAGTTPDFTNNANHIGEQTYIDLGVSVNLDSTGKWKVYGNLLNVADKGPPPPVASFGASSYQEGVMGRVFNVGVKFQE